MRIAILQFAPRLGKPEWNISRADALLAEAGFRKCGGDIGGEPLDALNSKTDILILPELAFSGYNFPSLPSIRPFLEPTAAGRSAAWAVRTARRLHCLVAIGYPETTSDPSDIPSFVGERVVDVERQNEEHYEAQQHNFNSLLIVAPDGQIAAHYRKTHLYYTDASWAEPSLEGWKIESLPIPSQVSNGYSLPMNTNLNSQSSPQPSFKQVRTSFAICMDLNPRYFTAPWDAYEAANFTLSQNADFLLSSMAWLTDRTELDPEEPDLQTITYWIERLGPLLRQGEDGPTEVGAASSWHGLQRDETLVAFANRAGIEPGPTRACELDPVLKKRTAEARMMEQALENKLDSIVGHGLPTEAFAAGHANGEEVPAFSEGQKVHGGNNIVFNTSESLKQSEGTANLGPIMAQKAHYAGSSAVMALGRGKARVWGMMGNATEGVLIVNTAEEPMGVYVLKQRDEKEDEEVESQQERDTGEGHDEREENEVRHEAKEHYEQDKDEMV